MVTRALHMQARAAIGRAVSSLGIGAALGLCVVAVETALLLRGGAMGVAIDVSGPFAAVFAAVRSVVPGLMARIAAGYVVAGALLGLCAGAVAAALAPRRRLGWILLVSAEWSVLVVFLAWDRAILRPALFDDVPPLSPLLTLLVDGGEPWHPRAAAVLWCAVHGGAAILRRVRLGAFPAVFALPVAVPLCLAVTWWVRTPTPTVSAADELGPATVSTRRGPLIVLIGIDAFRPDRLSAYGGTGAVAPNLERFLRDATRFDQAYTPIAQTEPAWRTLLTGRWPHRHGVRYPLTAASRWVDLPTFPAELSRRGFHTEFHTDCSRFNFQDERSGFAVRAQPPRGALNFALEKFRLRGVGIFGDNALGARVWPELVDNRALAGIHDPFGYAERLADRVVEVGRAGPALFAFHATAAHFPGDPVYPHYRQFVPRTEPLERRTRMHFSPIAAGSRGGWTREGAEALYDELLSQADRQLGVVLDGLKRAGRYDDATVIVFSDHGESFHADAPALAGATPVHGARLGPEENRILFAIKPAAGRFAARPESVSQLVRLVDLAPTVLDLVGAPALPTADGVSLVPLLEGRTLPPLRLYAETGFTHASPAAFDPAHAVHAPRTFDAYRVRADGVVELGDAAHEAVLREKDVGATDGVSWLVRSPRMDGSLRERCIGNCQELARWLAAVAPLEGSPAVR